MTQNIKDKIIDCLNEQPANLAQAWHEYGLQYKASNKTGRDMVLSEITAKLLIVMKNAHSKVGIIKLKQIMADIEDYKQM